MMVASSYISPIDIVKPKLTESAKQVAVKQVRASPIQCQFATKTASQI
jgi:hypothetical protein